MNPFDINFEPSANSKAPSWSTRARPLSLGGFTYHGLTDAAHAGRDVGLLALGFALEAVSFVVLGHKFNFAGSLIAGLWIFDLAGALLWHSGSADSRLREARIKTAASHEDEEAIREQRPWHYVWLNVLGAMLIAGPCLFKCLLLLSNPLVFKVMGLGGPALLVTYIGIAIIHFGYTGPALAYLHARRAEKKELTAMLKSGSTDEQRKRHPNRIKAHRKHHFISQLELEEVDNIGGHSLIRDMSFTATGFRYVMTTWGRLFDHQVAEMVARQTSAEQKSKLGREGLTHQLEIEQSAPLAVPDSPATETLVKLTTASHVNPQPASTVPSTPAASRQPESPQTPKGSPFPMNGLRQAGVALLMLGSLVGLNSCNKPETMRVKMVLVCDHELASGENAPFPESLLNLVAPELPLLERFVIEPSAVRLNDNDSPENTDLLPPPVANALFGAMQDMSQLSSPELEAADRRQRLTGATASVLGRVADASEVPSESRWQNWAKANHESGCQFIALRQKPRPTGAEVIELEGVGRPTEVTKPEEVHALMEVVLRDQPEASFAVLIDPPFTQPTKVVETIPHPATALKEAASAAVSTQGSKTEATPAPKSEEKAVTSTGAPKSSQSAAPTTAPHNVTVSGPFLFMPEKSGDVPRATDADGRELPIQRPEFAGNVPFEKTESRINPKTEEALIDIDDKGKAGGFTEVILHGSADPKGNTEMVEGLSQRRCNTVKAWLQERGYHILESIPLGADKVPTSTSKEDYDKHRVVRVFFVRRQPVETSSR